MLPRSCKNTANAACCPLPLTEGADACPWAPAKQCEPSLPFYCEPLAVVATDSVFPPLDQAARSCENCLYGLYGHDWQHPACALRKHLPSMSRAGLGIRPPSLREDHLP